MRKIIYTRADGGMSVVHPVINNNETMTETEAEQRAFDKLPLDAINPHFIDSIPSDRTFRNAWEDQGVVQINMEKAREIHKEVLRRLRTPKLAELDVAYMRADEIGDTAEKAIIAAKKQALRDVTADPAIAAATTPEELKAVRPAALV